MDALVFTLLTGFYALTQGYPVAFNVLLVAGIGVYWLGMRVHSLKTVALVVVIGVVIGLGTVDVVSQRYGSAPQLFAHDGLIQSEEATFFILQGKNPYMEDYTATSMALWDFRVGDLSVNPALYHYPYTPPDAVSRRA